MSMRFFLYKLNMENSDIVRNQNAAPEEDSIELIPVAVCSAASLGFLLVGNVISNKILNKTVVKIMIHKNRYLEDILFIANAIPNIFNCHFCVSSQGQGNSGKCTMEY